MASATPTTPLLNIDTLVQRPVIRIDGVAYEMLNPGELSVLQTMRFVAQARRIEELQNAAIAEHASPDGAPAEELERIADGIVRAVLPAVPAEVINRLSGARKLQVAEVFIMLLLQNRLEAAGAMADMVRQATRVLEPTGASSLRASSVSTAATRANGWMARLWRWFGRA